MTKLSFILALLKLLSSLGAFDPTPATTVDCTWDMPYGNPALTCELPAECGTTNELKQQWNIDFPKYDSPLYIIGHDDKIFVAAQNTLTCLRASDGHTNWVSFYVDKYAHPLSYLTYYEGKVYIALSNDFVYCFNADNGEVIWSTYHYEFLFVRCLPILDGKLFIGTETKVFCLDASNGKFIWETWIGEKPETELCVAGGMVMFATRTKYICLSQTTGEKVWSINEDIEFIGANPVVYKNMVIFAPDGLLLGFDMKTGRKDLRKKLPTFSATLALSGSRVIALNSYVSNSCYDIISKKVLWISTKHSSVYGNAPPIVFGDHIFTITRTGLTLIDVKTDAELKSYKILLGWKNNFFLQNKKLYAIQSTYSYGSVSCWGEEQ